MEVLRFMLAGERWGIEAGYVLQVFRLADLARLPGAPPPVLGVTAWRGRMLTVLDLRQALGLAATALDELDRVIALGEERPAFGVLADTVEDIVTLRASAIQPAREGGQARREFLKGVTTDAVVIVDAAALLRGYAPRARGG
jgi:purine-binding chemotaxis protein CheW